MNELKSLESLLSGLAPVCRLHFQLWDDTGKLLFFTEGTASEMFLLNKPRNLAETVIGQNIFQYHTDGKSFLCGQPLRNGQKVFGALLAGGPSAFRWNSADVPPAAESPHSQEMERLLGSLTALFEEKLTAQQEIEEMAQKLDQGFEDLYLYARIASQIKTLKLSDDQLRLLMEELLESMRADAAFAYLSHNREYKLDLIEPRVSDKLESQSNFFEKILDLIPLNPTAADENYFIINDSREDPPYRELLPDPYRFLAVKVQYQGVFYGWLGLLSFNLQEIFRQGELKLLLSLAEQLAMVIDNTNLYKNLEKSVVNMVKSLVFAIEAKDRYTRGHSERVSTYCMLMGARLGLNKKEYEELKWSSILHDIGKIGIPENILNKKDRLTDEEYEIIKNHPAKGSKILKPIAYLTDSLPGIIHHHERFDGKGYPDGLKGEEIPLPARIIAVADTFDAINFSRSYRDGSADKTVFDTMEKLSGNQLDPRLVEVFKKVYFTDMLSD